MADFKSFSIIDSLLETVNSSTAAFGGPKKGVIDKAEFCGELTKLKNEMMGDLENAFNIEQQREDILNVTNSERDSIINDARNEAERIISEAKALAEQMISKNSITVESQHIADEMIHKAKCEASKIKDEQEAECTKMKEDTEERCRVLKEQTLVYVTKKMKSADETLNNASQLLSRASGTFSQFCNDVNEQLNANRRTYVEIKANVSVDEIFRENQG